MIAAATLESPLSGSSEIDAEQLARAVDASTHRRIQDLDVISDGYRVIVTGRSRSYYVKQLATQAIVSALPHVELDNEIVVCPD